MLYTPQQVTAFFALSIFANLPGLPWAVPHWHLLGGALECVQGYPGAHMPGQDDFCHIFRIECGLWQGVGSTGKLLGPLHPSLLHMHPSLLHMLPVPPCPHCANAVSTLLRQAAPSQEHHLPAARAHRDSCGGGLSRGAPLLCHMSPDVDAPRLLCHMSPLVGTLHDSYATCPHW